MYCQNCGTEVSGNEKFCSECGAPMSKDSYAGRHVEHRVVVQDRRKEPIIAVVLNLFLFPGLGQLYAGKPKRFLLVWVLFGGSIALLMISIFSNPGAPKFVFIILALVVGYWQVYDGYKCVSQYNTFLREHGRAPTEMDIW
ncbi:MAG: zinc-ribbon domain-containing protein [Candidatus Heimdallarchaeota archaeon]|nr:zinc-ribbon domain-containing protein [Candidatus Heimdallarchaeota archaeon]MCK5049003.1 zinc-ribbon domain-containing protein [Candidatus Heimdallarchaeota archaeon]